MNVPENSDISRTAALHHLGQVTGVDPIVVSFQQDTAAMVGGNLREPLELQRGAGDLSLPILIAHFSTEDSKPSGSKERGEFGIEANLPFRNLLTLRLDQRCTQGEAGDFQSGVAKTSGRGRTLPAKRGMITEENRIKITAKIDALETVSRRFREDGIEIPVGTAKGGKCKLHEVGGGYLERTIGRHFKAPTSVVYTPSKELAVEEIRVQSRTFVTHSFTRILRRPHVAPQVAVPFGLRSVGHARLDPGRYEVHEFQVYAKILWAIEGIGEVNFGAANYRLSPGQIAVYLPGGMHSARALDHPWETRWITMDGPLPAQVLSGFGLRKEGVYPAGCPSKCEWKPLTQALADVTPSGEYQASALLYQLLTRIAGPRSVGKDPIVREMLDRIHSEWRNPDFGVEGVAEAIGVNRSVLSRRFRAETGIAPTQYLIRWRLQRASVLLQESSVSVRAIAEQCGYRDPAYFARAFRRLTGQTPMECRSNQQ